jgi:Coatomer beta subunit appendage platform
MLLLSLMHFLFVPLLLAVHILVLSSIYWLIPLRHCSVFGEDALVNVSVEKKDDNDGKLAGYIRIRSKTQGIALSLGDRITSVQRGLPEPAKQ